MRGTRWITAVLVGATAILGLVACGDGDGDDDAPALGRRGDLVANDMFRFEPEEFEIALNQETRFNFANEDDERQHNFTLTFVFTDPDNFVSVDVPAGESREVRFTARERPRDGFFSFYCRFHQSEGMQGKIRLS